MYGGGKTYWQYNIHLATSPTGIGKVYVSHEDNTYPNSFSVVNESSSMDFTIEYQDLSEGYIFLGWSEGEPATKPSDIFTKYNPYSFTLDGFDAGTYEDYVPSVDQDLRTDFYANFTSLIVESQNKDEGSAIILDSPFQVSLGTEVRIKAIAEAGYKFVGWRRTNVSGVVQEGFASTDNPYCFTTSVEKAGTYTAIFEETTEVIAHTVTTEDDSHGHLVADHETATAREVVYLTVSSDDGYETTSLKYDNFYADKVSDTRYRFIMPNEHVMISQTCAPITYTIGYNLDGGTVSTANPTQYTIETETITLTNPTKTGYAFAGWKRKGATETVITATIPKGSTRKRFYTAKWTPITYTVSFDKNADDATGEMADITLTYDEEQALSLNTFSREGYLFAGWNTMADGSGTTYSDKDSVINLTYVANGTVTLYAQWLSPCDYYFGIGNDGSADHPYTISTPEGWNYFCDCLQDNTTYNRFSGKTVKLMPSGNSTSISVSRMAGSSDHDFCGTFDGNGKTLRFTSTENVNGVAPFSYISETTPTGDSVVSHPSIRNLNVVVDIKTTATHASGLVGRMWGTLTIEDCTVSGTIQTSAKFAAGFIGEQNGAANITDCVSSVTIKSSVNGDGTHGGFVGRTTDTNCISHFEGCLFHGKLLTTNGTTNCGGFVGWNRGTVNVSNSLYAPADPGEGETWAGASNSATFARNGATVSNSYYTTDFNDGNNYTGQGKLVHRITADEYVNIAHTGTATPYTTSSITYYKAADANGDSDPFIAGIVYHDVVYAVQGDNVSLTLNHDTREGYLFNGSYTASAGTLTGTENPYSFTMPNEDVTITASYTAYEEKLGTDNDGSADHPWAIGSDDSWEFFCDALQQGDTFSGKIVKLADDVSAAGINVTRMAGDADHLFSGTFDGNGKTLHVKLTSEGEYTAPFRYVGNSTIKNLHTTGTVTTSHKFGTGLIGRHEGNVNVTDCRSSVTIVSSVNGDGTHGGFIATGSDTATINRCVFDGVLCTKAEGHTDRCGGFMGWSSTLNINNSLYAPAAIPEGKYAIATSGSCTFARNNVSVNNSYYTELLGTNQGQKGILLFDGGVPATANEGVISRNSSKQYDVKLQGRTLYKDGAWNTLCLPFDVTLEGSVLEGATAKTLTAATMNGDDLSLTFGNPDSATEPVTVLQAGVPYLIKWNEGTDIVEPTFTGVFIDNSATAIARKTVSVLDGDVKFVGYYDTFSIDQTNTDIYYMTADNTLKHTGPRLPRVLPVRRRGVRGTPDPPRLRRGRNDRNR